MDKTTHYTDKYLSQIPIRGSDHKLIVIGMVGLTGAGKSTVSKKLSEMLGYFVLSGDHIRRFLNEEGFEGMNPEPELQGHIGGETSRYLLENKISHIIDVDLINVYEKVRTRSESHGATWVMIHVTCPEEIIFKRLKERAEELKKENTTELSRAGVDEYLKRKEVHQNTLPSVTRHYTVDTSTNLSEQLEAIIQNL